MRPKLTALAWLAAAICLNPSAAVASETAILQPPAKLLNDVRDYCKSVAAPAPKRVEDVDGFFYECEELSSQCVRPLAQGYSFVEFEIKRNDHSPLVPLGLYRVEISEEGDQACATFAAAMTFDRRANSLGRFSDFKKCIALKRIESITAQYGYFTESYLGDDNGRLIAERQKILTLPENKIVAENRIVRFEDPDSEVTLNCSDIFRRRELYGIVIPPRVFAPLQK